MQHKSRLNETVCWSGRGARVCFQSSSCDQVNHNQSGAHPLEQIWQPFEFFIGSQVGQKSCDLASWLRQMEKSSNESVTIAGLLLWPTHPICWSRQHITYTTTKECVSIFSKEKESKITKRRAIHVLKRAGHDAFGLGLLPCQIG
jgi:hypothetical protein